MKKAREMILVAGSVIWTATGVVFFIGITHVVTKVW